MQAESLQESQAGLRPLALILDPREKLRRYLGVGGKVGLLETSLDPKHLYGSSDSHRFLFKRTSGDEFRFRCYS